MISWLLEKNLLPDFLIRVGICRRLQAKLDLEYALSPQQRRKKLLEWVDQMKSGPIALSTREANTQHYELPTEFFKTVLGRRLKYSSAYFTEGVKDLDQAEEAMLALTVERAGIRDGERVLELGCGWGSLTLYMAERFPGASITSVSNSKTQRDFITGEALRRGLLNVTVITSDMNEFQPEGIFDRVVSVEMFEHMRNYRALLEKIAGWLGPEGTLFVHIFVHRELAYPYDDTDPEDWIARYFFTGGLMPNFEIFDYFPDYFKVRERWQVTGDHYQKTCRAWLRKMDASKKIILPLFETTYGVKDALKWWVYWRVFFMACEELFAYHGGREWLVGHTLLEKRS